MQRLLDIFHGNVATLRRALILCAVCGFAVLASSSGDAESGTSSLSAGDLALWLIPIAVLVFIGAEVTARMGKRARRAGERYRDPED